MTDISARDLLTLNSLGEQSKHPFFTKLVNITQFSSKIRAVLARFSEDMYSCRSKKRPSKRTSGTGRNRRNTKYRKSCIRKKKNQSTYHFLVQTQQQKHQKTFFSVVYLTLALNSPVKIYILIHANIQSNSRAGVFIVNFEHILQLFLLFIFSTLNW